MKKSNQMFQSICGLALAVCLLSGCSAKSTEYAPERNAGVPEMTAAAIEENDHAEYPSEAEAQDNISLQYRAVYGDDDFNTEEYKYISENGDKSVADEPLSTFSIDVDTAAYSNVRRMINSGTAIPEDAVRLEEMINYFPYNYPQPEEGQPFSVTTEYSDCPWNEDSKLLMIGLKAKDIDFTDRPASNFVFLLDVSGSMYSDDKLPLVQKSFVMLTENLTERDRVSIVTYAGFESVVLNGEPGNHTSAIIDAIESLEAGGSTAGAAGITKAYELARNNYIAGGNNRVILATDGDLNVGVSSEDGLTRLVKEMKESGVHLSVLGVGTGNIKDNKMKALAVNGDGNYNYLDSVYEAKKVLVDEMGGTLITVAKDVKIQVEFNSVKVSGYRLVGYENRLLNKEDFSDDLLTVNLRYKAPNGDTSKLLSHPVAAESYRAEASADLTFAAAVADFGMVLLNSENKGTATFNRVIKLADTAMEEQSDSYRTEFVELVRKVSGKQD